MRTALLFMVQEAGLMQKVCRWRKQSALVNSITTFNRLFKLHLHPDFNLHMFNTTTYILLVIEIRNVLLN